MTPFLAAAGTRRVTTSRFPSLLGVFTMSDNVRDKFRSSVLVYLLEMYMDLGPVLVASLPDLEF